MCRVHSVFNSVQWSFINFVSFLGHVSTCARFVSILRSRTSFKRGVFLIYRITAFPGRSSQSERSRSKPAGRPAEHTLYTASTYLRCTFNGRPAVIAGGPFVVVVVAAHPISARPGVKLRYYDARARAPCPPLVCERTFSPEDPFPRPVRDRTFDELTNIRCKSCYAVKFVTRAPCVTPCLRTREFSLYNYNGGRPIVNK